MMNIFRKSTTTTDAAPTVEQLVKGQRVYCLCEDGTYRPAIVRAAYNRVDLKTHAVIPTALISLYTSEAGTWQTHIVAPAVLNARTWDWADNK